MQHFHFLTCAVIILCKINCYQGSELIAVISFRLQRGMHFISWERFSGPGIPWGQSQPIRGQDEVSVDQSEGCTALGPHCMQYPPLWDKSNLSLVLNYHHHLTQWEKGLSCQISQCFWNLFVLWESSFHNPVLFLLPDFSELHEELSEMSSQRSLITRWLHRLSELLKRLILPVFMKI